MSLPVEQFSDHSPKNNSVQKTNAMSETAHDAFQTETVHTLIQQNEDLTARFNVTLRRTSQLEIKIQKLEDAYDLTVRQNDALIYETDVLREKASQTEQLFLDAHAQKEELQKTFAELYSRSRENEAQLNLELSRVQEQNFRLSGFYRRVMKYIKPNLKKSQARELSLEKQIAHLHTEVSRVNQICLELNKIRDDERRQKESSDEDFHRDLARLASNYEDQMAAQKEELLQLRGDLENLQGARKFLAAQLEKTEDDRVRFQNESIRESRLRTQLIDETKATEAETQEIMAAHRLHIQSLELEVRNLSEISKSAQLRARDAELKNQTLTAAQDEQKIVHEATLGTLHSIVEREARSARLNVELSRALKDARAEIERMNIETVAAQIQNARPDWIESAVQAATPSAVQAATPSATLSDRQPEVSSSTQVSSDKFKFSRPGKGIMTPPVAAEFEPVEFEAVEVEDVTDEMAFIDDTLEIEAAAPPSKDAGI